MFQLLLLDSENTGKDTGSLRDARNLVITDEQFQAFLSMHEDQPSLVPENNESIKTRTSTWMNKCGTLQFCFN